MNEKIIITAITPHNSKRVWIKREYLTFEVINKLNNLSVWKGSDNSTDALKSWELPIETNEVALKEELYEMILREMMMAINSIGKSLDKLLILNDR